MEFSGLKYAHDRWLEIEDIFKSNPKKEKKQALAALLHVLNETRIYWGTRKTTGMDRIREEDLSRWWVGASALLRPFDADFANRCETKGTYWADPTGWNQESAERAGILIDQMEGSLQKLLDEVYPPKKPK